MKVGGPALRAAPLPKDSGSCASKRLVGMITGSIMGRLGMGSLRSQLSISVGGS